MAKLMTIDTDRLARTATPDGSRSWTPIPHDWARENLTSALRQTGIDPVDERIQLSEDETKAIGHLTLPFDESVGWAMEAIWLNDHGKRMGLSYVCGERVFACTNGMVIVDNGVHHRRKRAGGADHVLPAMERLAHDMVADMRHVYRRNVERRQAYNSRVLCPEAARALIVRMAEADVLPSSKILATVAEFDSPSFDYDHNPSSLLNLQSAVTHVLKGYDDIAQTTRTSRLVTFLDQQIG